MTTRVSLTALLGFALLAAEADAQDVEMLGRVYGTRPPAAYFEQLDRDPGAFRFQRGFAPDLSTGPVGQQGVAPAGRPLRSSVGGQVRFPVVLGLFADSPATPPFALGDVQREFFDGPNSRFQTIPEFYAEMSLGRVDLEGSTFEWRRSQLTQAQVAGGVSGLNTNGGRVGEFIVQILTQLDTSIDWGRFDNDGPDGVPNSGDDDGFVDVLAVMHPTRGAECGGDNKNVVWSHRWVLGAWLGGPWVSPTPSARGGFIRVQDYTIQPVYSCDNTSINEIGVFAHELGHGFGLPDLYATTSSNNPHGAAGKWDLMATGSWGCGTFEPARPCQMGAWSKEFLGWLDLEDLPSGQDLGTLVLPPVETTGKAYRVEAGDGTRTYYLLENRQRIGSDAGLLSPGLLVWQIDRDIVDALRPLNSINNNPDRMGVWLRQADGLNDLGRPGGGRGDSGDPFPGGMGNRFFHAGSNPSSFSLNGTATGLTLMDIAESAPGSVSDVSFRAVTRFQNVTLRALGTGGEGGLFKVDGATPPAPEPVVRSAPFQRHVFEAAPGVAEEDGFRLGFTRWEDGSTTRTRNFTTGLQDALVEVTYGTPQVKVAVTMEGPVAGVSPGDLVIAAGHDNGWVLQGIAVTLVANARTGFAFREWTGELAGRPNPTSVTLDAPLTAGASFDLTFGIADAPTRVDVEAATRHRLIFAVENANLPATWSLRLGNLPEGLFFHPNGEIEGVAMRDGDFPIVVNVKDAIGLEATTALTLHVTPPAVGIEGLTAPFLLLPGTLNVFQLDYMDRNGNANGRYDLGDFRAFVLAHPELPMAAEAKALVASGGETITTVVPMGSLGGRR